MKKRLLCLLLCMVMLLVPVLTACSNEEPKDKQDEDAKTLTMWVVSEKEVSEDVAEEINDAINTLTRSKYKTELEIHYFTKDEYREKMDEILTAAEEAKALEEQKKEEDKKDPNKETEPETEYVQETETDVDGVVRDVYPAPKENQVDIIYIAGEEMYNTYIANEWLEALDGELSNASKKIKEYISSSLLSAVTYEGQTYAIPNNNIIGEYTYMLLDKTLMDKYSQQGYIKNNEINGLFNERVYNYLEMVTTFEDPANVVPIEYTYEQCLNLLAYYWSIDTDTYTMQELNDFSVFGHYYTDISELSRGSVILGYNSLFENPDFTKNYLKLNEFKFGDEKFGSYFGDATGKTSAIRFARGDSTILKNKVDAKGYAYCTYEGKDYYPIVVKYPSATADDIYGNMFGVTTFTASLERSMEIVTYLNTNSEFRNLLQYGVEGKHYDLVKSEDGNHTVKRRTDKQGEELYVMDLEKTGNIFVAYREPTMSSDIWDSGKAQNRASLVDPMLGFDLLKEVEDTIEEPEGVTYNSVTGYYLNYATGYSKDVFEADETLKAWLEKCDEAGPNVYVLKTSDTKKGNWKYNFYVYNNTGNQTTRFRAVAGEVTEEKVVDEEGAIVGTTPVGAEMTFEYVADDSYSAIDYELSVVSILTKKDYTLDISYANGDSAITPVITEEEYLVLDTTKGTNYELSMYENITKASVKDDSDVLAWLDKCTGAFGKLHVLRYAEVVEGEKVQTIVVYRPNKSYTTLNVVPYMEDGKMEIKLQFNSDGETAESVTDQYILTYIRVYVDADVEVTCSATANGKVEAFNTDTVADKDPDYELIGALHTSLIKELQQLSDDLVAMLNNCQSYEEVQQMTEGLAILLTSKGNAPNLAQIKHVGLNAYAKSKDFATLHELIIEAVSEDPKTTQYDDYGDEILWRGQESFVFYYSPYAIYYAWAKANGYVPAEK